VEVDTMKILVIEDEDQLRRTVAKMLTTVGHEVVEAADGLRGMELFRKEKPDLVITDIVMPNQEGLETIIELRRRCPQIRIIAMSGGFTRDDNLGFLKMARRLGADETIPKPFRAQELRKLVSQLSLVPRSPASLSSA
jgi:DNA-binding response OmpR family regulator